MSKTKTVGDLMEDMKSIKDINDALMDYDLKRITADELLKRTGGAGWIRIYLAKYYDILQSAEIKNPDMYS